MTSAEMNTGTLYVVATPIGNLADLTRRAENILASVEIVAAEDTRRTAVLLDHIGHRAPQLLSYHEHNKKRMTLDLLERLERGHDVALVSDAGTPVISDPGFELVRALAVPLAREHYNRSLVARAPHHWDGIQRRVVRLQIVIQEHHVRWRLQHRIDRLVERTGDPYDPPK